MPVMRDQQLDGLRAFAVALVLYDHLFASGGSFAGHVGVRLFFVLSGFLITRLLLEARSRASFEPATAIRSFYIRRALRIIPPYFAVLGFVWVTALEPSRRILLWHALYLSNFWYAVHDAWSPWILCHTWSLSIEEQFYVIWPLIILLAPRRLIVRICIGVIALSLAYRLYWPFTGTASLARDLLPPASMDALASGALLAAYRSQSNTWPRWIELSWVPLAIVFLVVLAFRDAPAPPIIGWTRWVALEVLPLVPLVVIVGRCSAGLGGRLGRLMELRPLMAAGRVSYGVYLFHPILLALVVEAQPWIPVNVSEQGPGRFLVTTAATLIVASISWLAFERPLNGLKRHFPYTRSRSPLPTEPNGALAPVYAGRGMDRMEGA